MERDGIEGATAAAEYFLALYPYVYSTGDLEVWREMSHPECEFCTNTSEDVAEMHGDGGFAVVGEFVVDDVVAHPPDEEFPHFRVEFTGTEGPSSLYSRDGELELSSPGGAGSFRFAVIRQAGDWQIREALAESEER